MECLSYCIANKIELVRLDKHLQRFAQFTIEKHWHALAVFDGSRSMYVFANGTVVLWGIKRHEVDRYLGYISPSCVSPLVQKIYDQCSYRQGEQTSIQPHHYYNLDCLVLESDDPSIKLGLSYGFSQSVKLKYFEARLDQLVETNAPYINQLSRFGKIKLRRSGMRRVLGSIVAVKAELNITSNFSYQPRFFWQNASLESYYLLLERYLDIAQRKQSLDQQLDTLNEIFHMFSNYLDDRHSNLLEVVIIVLITIEITFNVLNWHF